MKIASAAVFVIQELKKAGYEAYVVGGAVRDLLLEKEPLDYDFTTNAKPEQIMEVFPESFCANDFGTVSITPENLREQAGEIFPEDGGTLIRATSSKIEGSQPKKIIDYLAASKLHDSLTLPENGEKKEKKTEANFEITTFRSKELYEQDARHPSSFVWGKTIEEDLERRDFTINALAMSETGEIIDQYEGQKDLEKMLIRTVGEAKARFREDALRMLRAIRLSVELNFMIEEKTWTALVQNVDLLAEISQERIRDELLKMLSSDYPAAAIELLDQSGALQYVIPELVETKGVMQSGHHTTDVWTHSLDSLHYCPSDSAIVRLATLLHDAGKVATAKMQNGQWTFYNHQIVGAKMASRIGRRLHLTKEECERLYNLVRHHMFYYQPHDTDAAIRRLMRQVGLENLDDLLALREGDRLGSGVKATSWRLEELKERMIEQLHQPFDVRDLAIDGHDLMSEFKLKPSKILGEILNFLMERVLDDSSLNQRDKLLALANAYLLENAPESRQ